MEEIKNPYSPPQSKIMEVALESVPIPASKIRRFINYLVDLVMQFLMGIVFGAIIIMFGGEEALAVLDGVPDIVIGVPFLLLYYVSLEGLFGITIGKLATGTRVVNEKGLPPSLNQIIGRSFSRVVPFEAFSFFGNNGRGWHDTWPKTYVIKVR